MSDWVPDNKGQQALCVYLCIQEEVLLPPQMAHPPICHLPSHHSPGDHHLGKFPGHYLMTWDCHPETKAGRLLPGP